MNLNNIYNFKNPVKHFINIDELAFPQDIQNFNLDKLVWTEPIKFRIRKDEHIKIWLNWMKVEMINI